MNDYTTDRVTRFLTRSQFFTYSALVHLLLVAFIGTKVLYERFVDDQGFVAPVNGGFVEAPPQVTPPLVEPNPLEKPSDELPTPASSAPDRPATSALTTLLKTNERQVSLPSVALTNVRPPVSMSSLGRSAGTGSSGIGTAPSGAGKGLTGRITGGGFGGAKKQEAMLSGSFYDLKQTRGRKPSGVNAASYGEKISLFLNGNWDESLLNDYYKAPKTLYLSDMYLPLMDAQAAPEEYGVAKNVEPGCWVALYQGTIAAPYTDEIRFWGYADDMLQVRLANKWMLDGSRPDSRFTSPAEVKERTGIKTGNGELARGPWMRVTQGQAMPAQVLVGERPGGKFCAILLVERKSAPPSKGANGRPILDLFRLANATVKVEEDPAKLGPVNAEAPVWMGVNTPMSMSERMGLKR